MMKKFLFGCSLALSASSLCAANLALPHQFSNGQVADATEVNANFQSLADAIDQVNSRSAPMGNANHLQLSWSAPPVAQSGNGFLYVDGNSGNLSFLDDAGQITDLVDSTPPTFPNGNPTSPSIQFAGDPEGDSGLNYSGNTNPMEWVYNGNTIATIGSNGLDIVQGNLSLSGNSVVKVKDILHITQNSPLTISGLNTPILFQDILFQAGEVTYNTGTGLITLKAGKTYRLISSMICTTSSGAYQFYNHTAATAIGTKGFMEYDATSTIQSSLRTIAYIKPTVDTEVSLQLVSGGSPPIDQTYVSIEVESL